MPTIDRPVAASTDDAEEYLLNTAGNMDLASSDIEIGYDVEQQRTGLRFLNMTIPAGATIDVAYVQYEVKEIRTNPSPDNNYYCELDDTGTFTTTAFDISNRTYTTASVNWNTMPSWPTVDVAGADQRTPDLSVLIQEVIDDGAWVDGNAIVVITDDPQNTEKRTAKSWDFATGTGAPILHVEYTAGSTASVPTFKYSEPV